MPHPTHFVFNLLAESRILPLPENRVSPIGWYRILGLPQPIVGLKSHETWDFRWLVNYQFRSQGHHVSMALGGAARRNARTTACRNGSTRVTARRFILCFSGLYVKFGSNPVRVNRRGRTEETKTEKSSSGVGNGRLSMREKCGMAHLILLGGLRTAPTI